MKKFLKSYPLTIVLVAAIWTVCLIPIPETPLDNVTLMDKWVHIAMYLVLAMTVGHEYFHRPRCSWSIGGMAVRAWLLPVCMGGAVELAQAYLTTCRTGDWLDFAANALGGTLGFIGCTAAAKWMDGRRRAAR